MAILSFPSKGAHIGHVPVDPDARKAVLVAIADTLKEEHPSGSGLTVPFDVQQARQQGPAYLETFGTNERVRTVILYFRQYEDRWEEALDTIQSIENGTPPESSGAFDGDAEWNEAASSSLLQHDLNMSGPMYSTLFEAYIQNRTQLEVITLTGANLTKYGEHDAGTALELSACILKAASGDLTAYFNVVLGPTVPKAVQAYESWATEKADLEREVKVKEAKEAKEAKEVKEAKEAKEAKQNEAEVPPGVPLKRKRTSEEQDNAPRKAAKSAPAPTTTSPSTLTSTKASARATPAAQQVGGAPRHRLPPKPAPALPPSGPRGMHHLPPSMVGHSGPHGLPPPPVPYLSARLNIHAPPPHGYSHHGMYPPPPSTFHHHFSAGRGPLPFPHAQAQLPPPPAYRPSAQRGPPRAPCAPNATQPCTGTPSSKASSAGGSSSHKSGAVSGVSGTASSGGRMPMVNIPEQNAPHNPVKK